jgi:hypothetical protein
LIKNTYQSDTKSRKSDSKSQKTNTKSRKSKKENNQTPRDTLNDNSATFSFNFQSHEKKETKHKSENRNEGHRPGRRHDNHKVDDEDFKYTPTWTQGVTGILWS